MPKPAKIALGILIAYVGLIVAFESMMGILQPEQGQVLKITTTGDDGVANDRVLAWLDDDGTVFVSANHWPRAWYNEAIANPQVQVSIDGQGGDYPASRRASSSGSIRRNRRPSCDRPVGCSSGLL